jgi:hypothetical protein
MSLGIKISQSPLRPAIDELILRGLSAKKIARHLFETGASDTFSEKTISDYKSNFFRTQDSPLMAVAKVAQDLVNNDPPKNGDMFASHFTFTSTKADLDMIYERIEALKKLAKENPDDEQYDKRLFAALESAGKIRDRVYKFNYEQIRRSILITVGKKICMAAVSIFLPYIAKDKRAEVLERFESAVTPMLGIRDLPGDPDTEEAEIVVSAPAAAKPVAAVVEPPAAAPKPSIQPVYEAPPMAPEAAQFLDDDFFMSEDSTDG